MYVLPVALKYTFRNYMSQRDSVDTIIITCESFKTKEQLHNTELKKRRPFREE